MEHTKLGRRVQTEHQLELERKMLSREGIGPLIQRMEREVGRITMNASNAEI